MASISTIVDASTCLSSWDASQRDSTFWRTEFGSLDRVADRVFIVDYIGLVQWKPHMAPIPSGHSECCSRPPAPSLGTDQHRPSWATGVTIRENGYGTPPGIAPRTSTGKNSLLRALANPDSNATHGHFEDSDERRAINTFVVSSASRIAPYCLSPVPMLSSSEERKT
jgi:hypothetical protein